MQLATLQSEGYDRREFHAAVSGRMDPRHRDDRPRKRLRGDFGQLVGVRP
jgi:hypothetical protein